MSRKNKNTGEITFRNPWPADRGAGPNPSGQNRSVQFSEGPTPAAEAWEELFDPKERKPYWYNGITGKVES